MRVMKIKNIVGVMKIKNILRGWGKEKVPVRELNTVEVLCPFAVDDDIGCPGEPPIRRTLRKRVQSHVIPMALRCWLSARARPCRLGVA